MEDFVSNVNNWNRTEDYGSGVFTRGFQLNALGHAIKSNNLEILNQLIEVGVSIYTIGMETTYEDFYFTEFRCYLGKPENYGRGFSDYLVYYKWDVESDIRSILEAEDLFLPSIKKVKNETSASTYYATGKRSCERRGIKY